MTFDALSELAHLQQTMTSVRSAWPESERIVCYPPRRIRSSYFKHGLAVGVFYSFGQREECIVADLARHNLARLNTRGAIKPVHEVSVSFARRMLQAQIDRLPSPEPEYTPTMKAPLVHAWQAHADILSGPFAEAFREHGVEWNPPKVVRGHAEGFFRMDVASPFEKVTTTLVLQQKASGLNSDDDLAYCYALYQLGQVFDQLRYEWFEGGSLDVKALEPTKAARLASVDRLVSAFVGTVESFGESGRKHAS